MKRLALIAAIIAIASPAMAQTTGYGTGGMLIAPYSGGTGGYGHDTPTVTPYGGGTLGYTNDPPMVQFNRGLGQQQTTRVGPCFANAFQHC